MAGLLLLFVATLVGPLLWNVSANAINEAPALSGPSLTHPLGTDGTGRDMLARVLAGSRISLSISACVALASTILGGLIGVLAAVVGGWLDVVLMRASDVLLSFPQLVLAIAVTMAVGPGLRGAAVGIGLAAVPVTARLVRADVARRLDEPYVVVAQHLGIGRMRAAWIHVLPQTTGTLAVQAASVFGGTAIALAALGFVGIGAQVPTPEWGAMIAEGASASLTGAWWVSVFPGLGLIVTVATAQGLARSYGRSRELR